MYDKTWSWQARDTGDDKVSTANKLIAVLTCKSYSNVSSVCLAVSRERYAQLGLWAGGRIAYYRRLWGPIWSSWTLQQWRMFLHGRQKERTTFLPLKTTTLDHVWSRLRNSILNWTEVLQLKKILLVLWPECLWGCSFIRGWANSLSIARKILRTM